jgi:hypothetical protein
MSRRQIAEKLPCFGECLGCSGTSDEPCTVNNLVNNVLFVEAAHAFLCYHRTSLGDSYICRCPVRKDIYERHGR